MSANDDLAFAELEGRLSKYRPAGPSKALRARVLADVSPRAQRPIGKWLAVAALILLVIGLQWHTQQMDRETRAILDARETLWTPEAEELAQELDGDGAGRRYLAFALLADRQRWASQSSAAMFGSPGDW
ncbi:MAG TPA: hypothetical protein PKY77_02335 [Phycisphaerae bacterium]|nr:hypothetical protein [Phycisphaerae bacterium]HRY66581.1 hypothetical protein [Phycisphaerae bacterium]HSA27001.1 hypothetical protein [Phycisphaerae bacterium]